MYARIFGIPSRRAHHGVEGFHRADAEKLWRQGPVQLLWCKASEELNWKPDAEANSIGFIVWHVSGIEDRWLHRFAQDAVEFWVADGWHGRFELPEGDTGLGYSARQIASFPNPSSEDLLRYLDDVHTRTIEYLRGLGPKDFGVAPGRTPFPERPNSITYFEGFTTGRMFRQLVGELNQQVGQVAYLRGLQRGLDR